ncbi:MAG: methyltransferase domain-containing protein [Pyrinomonadaceae bacterium]
MQCRLGRMNCDPTALISLDRIERNQRPASSCAATITEFYDQASADYLHWSRGANMHLGYFRWGMNPFRREEMLDQLNREVAARLAIKPNAESTLIDLGCGVGATSRTLARLFPNSAIKGITIVASQVETAKGLNKREFLQDRIRILCADYTSLPFARATADGVWAVESACHAAGAAKEDLIREMARVLKPGARFVVADLFVVNSAKTCDPLTGRAYRAACRSWAVPEMPSLDPFLAALRRHGFTDISVEDISWRVAPSVAHAPFAVLSFILKKWWRGEPIGQQSRNNLKASLLAPIIGMNRGKFRYCLVSGRTGE